MTARDTKLIAKFPYQNDQEDGAFFWLQKNLVNPADLANLAKQFQPDYKPIVVEFDVYQKNKLICGFPKKTGELTCEELAINGKCRFRSIFEISNGN